MHRLKQPTGRHHSTVGAGKISCYALASGVMATAGASVERYQTLFVWRSFEVSQRYIQISTRRHYLALTLAGEWEDAFILSGLKPTSEKGNNR